MHRKLVACGVASIEAFTITMRVFRSGGLTKDAVYLRGLRDVVAHVAAGGRLDVLWLGKMSLIDVPHVEDLRQRGVLRDPLLVPRYLADADVERAARPHHRVHHTCRPDRSTSMRVGFVVNSVQTEKPQYTTTRLAMAATRMGHETWLIGVGDFAHQGRRVDRSPSPVDQAPQNYKSLENYLAAIQGDDCVEERICVDDLDVVMMRNDPAEDVDDRPWAVTSRRSCSVS